MGDFTVVSSNIKDSATILLLMIFASLGPNKGPSRREQKQEMTSVDGKLT